MSKREFQTPTMKYTEVAPLGIAGVRWRVWRAESPSGEAVVVKIPKNPEEVAPHWPTRLAFFARLRSIPAPLRELFSVPYDFIRAEFAQIQPNVDGLTLQELAEQWQSPQAHAPPPAARLRDRLWLAFQLATAAEVLERYNLCHGDFSLGNVMVSPSPEGLRLRLIDFDEAFERDAHGISPGTEGYRAPEVESGSPTTWSSERFSLAILIHFLLTRRHPHHDNMRKAAPDCYEWDRPGRLRVLGLFGEGPIHAAFERALCGDPLTRPSALMWRQVLANALDELYECQDCHFEIVAESSTAADARPPCPRCAAPP
jgi:serine/threonine protein kinase